MKEMTKGHTHKEYRAIDVGKMVAALFVVSIHSQLFVGATRVPVHVVINNVAVPFFFVASAFFFFKKQYTEQNVRRYVSRLLTLYAFWFVVELPLTVLHRFIEPDTGFLWNVFCLVKAFFLGSTFGGSWFLMALVISIPLVKWLSKRIGNMLSLVLGILLYIPIVLYCIYQDFMPSWYTDAHALCKKYVFEPSLSFIPAIMWCSIGKIIAENEDRVCAWGKAKSFCALFLSVVIAYTEVLTVASVSPYEIDGIYFSLPLIVTALFVFLLKCSPTWNIDYKKIRKYSTLFFFSHFIFVFIFVVINKHIVPINVVVKYLLVVACCFILSTAILKFSERKWGKFLKYSY